MVRLKTFTMSPLFFSAEKNALCVEKIPEVKNEKIKISIKANANHMPETHVFCQ